jgi:nucleotide-binding universal stress UspA family protein
MFSHLLVALDGTDEAAVALAPALALARSTAARLTLLRAVPLDQDAAASNEAHAYLDRVAADLGSGDVAGAVAVRRGQPAEAILAAGRDLRADLIVMATHGRSGVGRAILGSVAETVLAGTRVPVLLVRPGGHEARGVRALLVPLDGAPGGAIALGAALGLARATGARIVLLQVVRPLSAYAYGGDPSLGGIPWEPDPGWDDEALAAARTYVVGMAGRLRHAGVAAEGRAILAGAGAGIARVLVAAAEEIDADLIVMSTHALTGPRRAIVGSVADEVVRTAHRGVLLVRTDAPVADPAHHPPAAAEVGGAPTAPAAV